MIPYILIIFGLAVAAISGYKFWDLVRFKPGRYTDTRREDDRTDVAGDE